jgi:hypothetical protein
MKPPCIYILKHSSIIINYMEVLPINRNRLSYH